MVSTPDVHTYKLAVKVCIIGMTRASLITMLCVEVGAQLYLTGRFLWPLLVVNTEGSGLLSPLRKVVVRTSIGVATTLVLNIAVKTSLTLFDGEPTWLCYLTCKMEGELMPIRKVHSPDVDGVIAFLAACILHWITKPILSNDSYESNQTALGIGFDSSAPTPPSVAVMKSTEISMAEIPI